MSPNSTANPSELDVRTNETNRQPVQGEPVTAQHRAATAMSATSTSAARAPEGALVDPESPTMSGVGTWLLKNIWYYACPAESLKRGKTINKVMLCEPVLIGRDGQGRVFAMRDICPHQAVPLSKGSFDGEKISCCFHGWQFNTNGVCTSIPSLVDGQSFNVCSVKTKSYPCTESQGSVFVYFGDNKVDLPSPPQAPGLDGLPWNKTTTTLLLPTHIDFAAAALIDPAHVPYVHNSWWWRSTKKVYLKEKRYIPDGNGWTMVRHRPSKNAPIFQAWGDSFETEIGFRLPGCRIEQVIFRGRTLLSGISCLTPIDDTHTELTHTTYWTFKGFSLLLRPIVNYFVQEFLGQDETIAKMQETVLKYKTPLVMTIPDAGTPGKWYFQLKKEWAESTLAGRLFKNPVVESILRWKT